MKPKNVDYEANSQKNISDKNIAPPLLSEKSVNNYQENTSKVSAFSISSIRTKKELEEKNKLQVKDDEQLPTNNFSETDLLLQWDNYSKILGARGLKIMEALMKMKKPVLNETKIIVELPNEGSKLDFEKEKNELLRYLRENLHNYDVEIDVIVNENVEIIKPINNTDRYNRLHEINPNIELLRSIFELDFES